MRKNEADNLGCFRFNFFSFLIFQTVRHWKRMPLKHPASLPHRFKPQAIAYLKIREFSSVSSSPQAKLPRTASVLESRRGSKAVQIQTLQSPRGRIPVDLTVSSKFDQRIRNVAERRIKRKASFLGQLEIVHASIDAEEREQERGKPRSLTRRKTKQDLHREDVNNHNTKSVLKIMDVDRVPIELLHRLFLTQLVRW